MSDTSDVLIVGAGVVGASSALELRRRGFEVTVLDRAAGPGFGSTSASSAVVRFNYSTFDGVAAAWESLHHWCAWEDHLGYTDPAGMARFVQRGLAFLDVVTVDRVQAKQLFDCVGVASEYWNPRELQGAVPGISCGRFYPPKPVTSDAFFEEPHGELGALYTPDAGYVDDPRLAAANLAKAAAARGAKFLYRNDVEELDRTGDVWKLRSRQGKEFEAPVILNAAGPWSTRINFLAGVGSEFRVSVRPMRQEVHSVPIPGELRERPMVPVIADLDLGVYIRPDSDDGLLVGSTEPECDELEWIADPDGASPHSTLERFESQVFRAARRFPELRVPSRPAGVAGVYDVASDWTPIYDRTDAPGYYVAMGTSGNQFKNAPLIGGFMGELIAKVEEGTDHDRAPIQYSAPLTGNSIDLGAFSRLRSPNSDSTGTVMG